MATDLSRRAMVLLRDASISPLEVVQRPPVHASHGDFVVVRADRRGFTHQKRTLEALVRSGHLVVAGTFYSPSPLGLQEAGA